MEDVVLHYRQSGSAGGLGSLLERTQKLLGPFPCRTPPVFTPWFPTSTGVDHRLPIRPARPAPVITDTSVVHTLTTPTKPDPGTHLQNKVLVQTSRRSIKRSWSVLTQTGVAPQTSPSLSSRFDHVVSVHRLHPRQRVKWVIGEHNCEATRDIEQVWWSLSRLVQRSRLPTCNANIQRDRPEIWVFCDVLWSEHVGLFLKDELHLSGTISLSVPRLGNILSM